MMEEMFRWMLIIIGLLAGMRVSMENEQGHSNKDANSNRGEATMPFCCNVHSVKTCVTICLLNEAQPLHVPPRQLHDVACADSENEHSHLHWAGSVKLPLNKICELSGTVITDDINPSGDAFDSDVLGSQRVCIALDNRKTSIGGYAKLNSKPWSCTCNQSCCSVCQQGITRKTISTSSIKTTHYWPIHASASTTTLTSKSAGHFDVKQTLLIVLVLLVFAFIIVAFIWIIRKRKCSGRSELSMMRTNQNAAVSSGYEPTVRENHYELSVEGVPIYTELELTQEPAPPNNTVYSSVQPTSEAVNMGRPVVYAELDNVAVAVSPVYSQPFEAEASASNAEYAEPFKQDNKSTASAPVPNLYDNIAAVDQQSDVYSLAKAIPLSDPSVIYSQPNKPGK